jgi:hypothetical protein
MGRLKLMRDIKHGILSRVLKMKMIYPGFV